MIEHSPQLITELDDKIEAIVLYAYQHGGASGVRRLHSLMESWTNAGADQIIQAAVNCQQAQRNAR